MYKLSILIIILLYIQNISCYVYFDVRTYSDNVIIQEIIVEPTTQYPNNEITKLSPDYTKRLTINIFENTCLYRYKNVEKDHIYNNENTNGIILHSFIYTIQNACNPTVLDCHDLILGPKIIYGYIELLDDNLKPRPNSNRMTNIATRQFKYGYGMKYMSLALEYVESLNNVRDFLQRYYSYNRKIISIETDHIRDELELFNNCCNTEHNYLYFYTIKINNKLFLKIGISTQDLFQTFVRQILIEQYTQDIESFRLIAMYEYSSLIITTHIEQIIEELLRIFNIDKEHFGLYSFPKSWNIIQSHIMNCNMISKSYIRENIEENY